METQIYVLFFNFLKSRRLDIGFLFLKFILFYFLNIVH